MQEFTKEVKLNNKNITFTNKRITAEEYIDFLKRTDLGSQYPKEDFNERIGILVNNTAISLIAYDLDKIVGVCFGLTDFAYWLFLSDLGVDRDYSKMGIGKILVQEAHMLAGGKDNIAMFTIANENAVGFYEKCDWKKGNDFMIYSRIKWTDFKVE